MEDKNFYVLRCPNCEHKCGMYLTIEEHKVLFELNTCRVCSHCGTDVFLNDSNLYLGTVSEVLGHN